MKKIVSALMSAALLVSCVPATPQARIDRNPEKFAALSKKNQDLVGKGLISRGMTPEAVELAWGPPARRFEGSENSKSTERWDYAESTPVYLTGYTGGFGYGYNSIGPYGRGPYNSFGGGFGPQVAYVPYRVASVWFIDHRVHAWEQAR
jgi:hypothetical protein